MKKLTLVALVVSLMLGLVLAGCGGGLDPSSSGLPDLGDSSGSSTMLRPVGEVPVPTGNQTVYLKGSGNNFDGTGWTNTFKVADDLGQHPSVWHIVYTGNNFADVTYIQITFTNGKGFYWLPSMGPSVNGGGNNPGWVIYAPYDWEIAYINKGNNNESESFLVTKDGKNVQFNISGYSKGKPNDTTVETKGSLEVTILDDALIPYEEITRQKTFARDKWNILERDVWDIYERDVQKYFQGTTQDFYVPVFKREITNCGTATLVSLGSNSIGSTGQTWVEFNIEEAKAGLRFEIADSSPYNRGTGYFYDVKVVGDKLYITFDKIFDADVGVWAASAMVFKQGHPNGKEGNSAVKTIKDDSYTFVLDATADANGIIYLFVHIAGGLQWVSKDYYFAEWEFDHNVKTEPVFLRKEVTEYVKTGEGASEYVLIGTDYIVKDEISDVVIGDPETKYLVIDEGLRISVIDEGGNEVFEGAFSGLQLVSGLTEGWYFITLSNEGINLTVKTFVKAGEKNVVDFGVLISEQPGDAVTVYLDPKYDDNWIADVKNDIKVADVKIDNELADVILPPRELPDVKLGGVETMDNPFAKFRDVKISLKLD